jgi:uncharacterized tellurite resistance protein B-like protein
MFARLMSILTGASDQDAAPERKLQLAAAALLVEAASMDGSIDAVETEVIEAGLQRHFSLSADNARELLADARQAADQAVQLSGFARTVKDGFDHDDRVRLIEMLWDVALADGVVHDYEANLVRRIAGLIHVPDRDAGEARKRAAARLGCGGS